MKRFLGTCVALAVVAATAGLTHATSIAPYESDTESFAVSGTDEPGTGATVTGSSLWAGSVANLNNGGGGGYEQGIGVSAGLMPGDYVTYTFDLTNAAAGWDISQITTYASWSPDMGGRSRQGYSVSARLIDNSVVNILTPQVYIAATDKAASKVDITGLALTGVKSLTFGDFVSAPNGSMGNIYHEIDVFGTATVPEPTTIALAASGLFGLLCYAWRKRR